MNITFLNKKNNKKVIVFFNGWGFDERVVSHLDFGGFDVVEIHDYRDLTPINIDFSQYEEKYLVAWSLGVYVCNKYYEQFKDFEGFTAVNGTLKPVDDNYGIPEMAYNLTVENFNELTCKKFVKKIGANIEINRSMEDLRQELISIKNLKINKFLPFKKAVISTKDRIFPYQNMHSFWGKENINITQIEGAHYIFDLYKSWGDLI